MTIRFPHLRAAIARDPWAIMPDRLEAIAEVVERRAEGIRLTTEEIAGIKGTRQPNGVAILHSMHSLDVHDDLIEESRSAASQQQSSAPGSVIAVINVMGIIAQHASQVDDISGPGGTSTERVSQSLRMAIADPSVKSIVFNIDSPGGSVSGVQALGDEIFKARGKKPMIAQVNSLAASAAYWIASQADEIVMTPGAQVGSIGVYALHRDVSKAAEMEGMKFTFVSAGKYKVEGNSLEPLTDEASAAIQKSVNAYYDDFVKAVARGRGVKASEVKGGFAEGRTEKDSEAVALGMADSVATLNQTLQRLSVVKPSPGSRASQLALLERPENIGSLTFSVEQGKGVSLVGYFPSITMITPEALQMHRPHFVVDHDEGTVRLNLLNGVALYEAIGITSTGDWVCRHVSSAMTLTAEETSAEERDAYRRRRHAHRHRLA